jgi:hypothetical protein
MVNMDHGECDAQGRAIIEQAAEQGYGVGTPGDRYSDPLTGME